MERGSGSNCIQEALPFKQVSRYAMFKEVGAIERAVNGLMASKHCVFPSEFERFPTLDV
jgi:hypothetical protein